MLTIARSRLMPLAILLLATALSGCVGYPVYPSGYYGAAPMHLIPDFPQKLLSLRLSHHLFQRRLSADLQRLVWLPLPLLLLIAAGSRAVA